MKYLTSAWSVSSKNRTPHYHYSRKIGDTFHGPCSLWRNWWCHECVTHNLQNNTHLYACIMMLGLHQSFLVKSFGQTSWQTNRHKCNGKAVSPVPSLNTLTPRPNGAIFQTTHSNPFSWIKIFEFRLKFHWSLFLRFQLTIFQHWFR